MPRIDLARLRACLPPVPLTRFAPSPTGFLHVGHVVNAVYVWGLARALDGRVLLRIEDHDRGRCHPAYERALFEDLDWLGLVPDMGLPAEFAAGSTPYRQSDATAAYENALGRLRRGRDVFVCDCSRKSLTSDGGATPGVETRYPGKCRNRDLADGPNRGLRLRIDPEDVVFGDALCGPQSQNPAAQCGDLLLRDRLGQWTYQFAVVVDDLRHGVDLVVRGEDLLASTGRQIRLGQRLGRAEPPVFLHHPLVLRDDGVKLSKSNGDEGVGELRSAGVRPEEVLGRAAYLGGLQESDRPVSANALADLFLK